ncbi:MAG: methylmalonyl Co-A mutase-associated GTPase MeaB [Deltaproteobacteria bacterium]|nr:methylmalonyl Co-A mutase-associated GTPase MeaB [Deltaproteobacteria bacterium]
MSPTDSAMSTVVKKRASLSLDELIDGVRRFDRTVLGRAITLVESTAPSHMQMASQLLGHFSKPSGDSLRIGITGVPGVGKSTFIETLGLYLLALGKRVAVIAVDPSSTISGGSILGDKTRMERLVQQENCFIRPVPSKGTLGGVAQNTMEAMLLCEAAGFDVILVETVGVGQNEATVRELVDFFLLLMLPNAGDNLQGIKRGIMELADHILINKADGDNIHAAQLAQNEYVQAMEFMRAATLGWKPSVSTGSALEEEGIADVWQIVERFAVKTKQSQIFFQRRDAQRRQWLRLRIAGLLETRFFANANVQQRLHDAEAAFLKGNRSFNDAIEDVLSSCKIE